MLRGVVLGSLCAVLWGQGAPDFQRDVRPILNKKCLACHGPDEHGRQAGLRLDTFAGATARGAIVPGDAAKSRVMARVTSEKMPMPPSGPRLTTGEVDVLRRWIAGGATYSEHWRYRCPR
jgi:mono/diheme cytochrome c family protein